MASLGQPPRFTFFDGDGVPLYGGFVYTYESYSDTPLPTYTDPSKTAYNSNPIILDSRGQAGIWCDTATFKIIVKDASGTTLLTDDTFPNAAPAKAVFYTAAGDPLVGGKVYTYEAGTSTLQPTYTDATGATENSNPVILDANGEADIWYGASLYKVRLFDAKNVEIYTVDNYGP